MHIRVRTRAYPKRRWPRAASWEHERGHLRRRVCRRAASGPTAIHRFNSPAG